MKNEIFENVFLKLSSNDGNWMNNLRQNINILRDYYHWSMRVLSEKSGVSEHTLGNIMQGKTKDCDQSLTIKLAKAFGKGTGFGLGLLFFAPICYPILAFSKDTEYLGPQA